MGAVPTNFLMYLFRFNKEIERRMRGNNFPHPSFFKADNGRGVILEFFMDSDIHPDPEAPLH